MRRALAGGIAVLVLAAACSGDDDTDGSAKDPPERPEIGELPPLPDVPPFTAAPDGGEIRVVEQGFSEFTHGDEGERVLSWGVVVENTSAQAATYTDVKVEVVDAAGAPVPFGTGAGQLRVETIGLLLPGQRTGIAQTEPVHGTGAAGLEVDIGASMWFPADTAGLELATLTTSGVMSSPGDIDFTVDSAYSREQYVVGGALFRSGAGQIIGGVGRRETLFDGPLGPGRSTNQIGVTYPVPDSDHSRTEVFADVLQVALVDEATAVDAFEVPVEAGGDGDAAEFCALFEEFERRNATGAPLAAVGQDPRAALAPLAAIDPPSAIEAAWETFFAWRWAATSGIALASSPAGSTLGAISDQIREVNGYWQQECVGEQGYESGAFVFDPRDMPDERPPFAAPEAGGIEVVEQGFSPMADPQGDLQLSYGIVVENTSDQVATNVGIEVRPVGATLPEHSGTFTIPVLQPGQRYGLGETTYADATAMTGLNVTFVAGQSWWPTDSELTWGDVTTSEVTINHSPGGSYVVTFAMESTYPVRRAGTRFQVVFRNAEGQIVGGVHDQLSSDVTPGRSFGEVYSNYPVPNVADAATEVYV